jgi:probable HAF family extracellular repeat protein
MRRNPDPSALTMPIRADAEYLPLFIANGVTGMRIMWGLRIHQDWRTQSEAGQLLSPRMVIASPIMDGPKPFWPDSISISTEAQARQGVIHSKQKGADFVKVYTFLPREEYLAIADEAAVNNRGQAVGLAENATPDSFGLGFGQQARAFLWERGLMRDLGTLGGPDAFAIDINDRGQVLGVSFINSIPDPTTGVPTLDGFLWENGKMIDIPDPLGGTQISPYYLSERGQVVGNANLAGDNFEQARHPFLWEDGTFTDLGTFGGTIGDAYKINDAGQIVGEASFADGTYHAALWQRKGTFDLGAVANDPCSVALDINSRGQAVGWSGVCDQSAPRPFLWDKSAGMVDVNTLISANSGIYVFWASNINDRGEIAAAGLLPSGDTHAVLLIPCGADDSCCKDGTAPNAVSTISERNAPLLQRVNSPLPPSRRSWISHYRNSLPQQLR